MKHLLLGLALVVAATIYAQIPVETLVTAQEPSQFTYQPFIIGNTMMVALDDLIDKIAITKTLNKNLLTIGYEGKQVVLKLNSIEAQIDGNKVELPFRTFTITDNLSKPKKSVTFLPLRFAAQALAIPFVIDGDNIYLNNKLWKFGDKKILGFDLQKQRGYGYEGKKVVRSFLTCTGKDGFRTETGIFQTYKKVNANHKVVGREWGGYMYKPVYFNDATAAHGSSKMRPYRDSHGCARLYNETADWLIEWTPGKVPSNIKGDVFWYIPKEERIAVYVF